MSEIVSINGNITTPENAKISVFDRGFLFGDAVYEVTRSYGKVLFQLEAHLDRLKRSADAIGLNLGMSRDQLANEIYRVVEASGLEDVYMRIQVSRGEGPIGMNASLARSPNFVIYVKKFQPFDPLLYTKGALVATVPLLRNSKRAMDPNIKSGNYLNNVLGFNMGLKKTGSETQEVLMLNQDGMITEGATSNVFMVQDHTLITCPESFDILVGITRGLVLEIARKVKIPVKEKGFTVSELEEAQEAFLTASTREIMPIFQVNSTKLRQSPGPLVQALRDGYKELIHDYCHSYPLSRSFK